MFDEDMHKSEWYLTFLTHGVYIIFLLKMNYLN